MFEPIAIVGRSCILPGAHTPEALWDAVVSGRDLLSSAPADRWGVPPDLALTPDPAKSADRAWSDRGGYVSGFSFADELARDPFPRDAADLLALDPLFHWVLSGARAALRQAGHAGAPSDRVGAIFGNLSFPSSSMARYAEHVWFGRPAVDPRNRFMSGLPAVLLAEQLGLGGGAFALDAACASSLYAIALACERLQDRELDLAVAGAVCRSDDLFIHVGFCALDAMSRSGRSRPFHRDADGLVPAEGAAFVALKRLTDAEAAGDKVYGVIRGVGLANDGRGRGLLAPSSEGQVRALRAAWAVSGVDPARLGLVECHATGTPVGDAAEIHTLQAVFGDQVRDLPLGSLKSNLGHLITAAGAAALVKVLGAFEAGIRPPTLHAEVENEALAGTPFRLLHQAEPWPTDGPRLAAISAFGFGGNNAHLVVEEYVRDGIPAVTSPPRPRGPLAVVGMGVRAGSGRSTADFVADLRDGRRRIEPGPPAEAAAAPIALPLEKVRFPPRDLEQTLPQQLLVLDAALEAVGSMALPRERTAVLIGSQSDPEVCRYGARWRMRGWDRAVRPAALDRITPVLESAGVVGNMPNIPANRLGSQFDLGGPGFTVSEEELSGTRALALAARWLRAGTVDAAVVGAVDLSAEPVHEAASAAVVGPRTAGDAAVVLVLRRLEDALADGSPILAVLPDDPVDGVAIGVDGVDLSSRFGVAHAAHSLLHVAAAVASVAHGLRPEDGPATTWTGPRAATVTVRGMGGTHTVAIRAHGEPLPIPLVPAPPRRALVIAAHRSLVADDGAMPRAPHLPPVENQPVTPTPTPPHSDMAPAPSLGQRPTPTPTPAAPPVAPPPPARTAPSAAPQLAVAATSSSVAGPSAAVLAGLADLHRQLGAAHRTFVERQAEVHGQFLAMRTRTTQLLLDAAQGRAVPLPPIPAPSPMPVPVPVPEAAPRAVPVPLTVSVPVPVPVPAPQKPASGVDRRPAAQLPGPKWDRAQLEVLASDKISKVFGPLFARQDDFPRQVRMPEPPLLLADRVVGLDAQPGAMTTGVIWTETDVQWDSWYLHDGVMPAGVMIEAGQADLLLISWLGADFQNRGERVYRLLGCTLTYGGGLPRPGDTLRYQIHVDGHANLGATRIFFFHYDCVDQQGAYRLRVREGQAGFFSEAELAESGGILWTPETGEHDVSARLDPPVVKAVPRSYDAEQVRAFASGDGYACFGAGYERLQTQVRPPRMAPAPMSFWHRVSELDPKGGPWGRGYLRAEQDITADDWFFQGHFKDDPCMPGTMMFEACLQALGFYLAALGYTIRKDGWTFEPVPDLAYDLKCRGQVIPSSRHLVYEAFVEEVHEGPWPVVYADVLCTIDGLKAFHARRVGLRLRPDWPITSRPELQDLRDPEPVAAAPDGFRFGYASLLACAWGKPSDAFGPMYAPFDEGKHCARLPGPPYHFMSRITRVSGAIGAMEVGTSIDLQYDIPPDAWYFRENGDPTMPFCVLLEAALQPCGWIASYVGSALTTDKELFFRNLDGTATWTEECLPTSGTLTTKAKITAISTAGGMIIEGFDVVCELEGRPVYTMKTVFGFFPRAALANQIGITPTDAERATLHEPCDFAVDLTSRPARYCGGPLTLPAPMLLMLDRVTGFWPEGGRKGLGRLRSEKDVDPSEWFFKAHFFADPVQPGSLGLEALVQLLQFYMLHQGMHAGMAAPRFEPLMLDRPLTWKYRGQVVPENKVIYGDIEIVEVGEDERGRYAVCEGYLWVDQLRIYQAINLGIRIVDGRRPAGDGVPAGPADAERVLDPAAEPWLADHPPTWTLPALPAMSMVDRLAGAAKAAVGGEVVEVRDVVVHRWVVLPGPTRTRTVVKSVDGNAVTVGFEVWRDAPDPALSRFEAAATGVVVLAPGYPAAPPVPAAHPAPLAPNPYRSGHLFHGPAFQYCQELRLDGSGSSAILDARAGAVPPGTLHQGLLDGLTHALPHDELWRWSDRVGRDQAAYPHTVDRMRLYGAAPAGRVRVEARLVGFADDRRPRFSLVAVDLDRDTVWLELELTEILMPKGPIGAAPAEDRAAFLRDRLPVEGLALSEVDGDATVAHLADLKATDWLPGTVAAVYRSRGDLLVDVAVGDHVARLAGVHPGTVTHDADAAVSAAQPLTRWPIAIRSAGDAARVESTGAPTLDLGSVRAFWDRTFGLGRWPVEDLYYGMIQRFVRRVHVANPDAFAALRGRSVVYLANHQVACESLVFSIVASALNGVSTVTLAKAEHRGTWLGRLIAHSFAYPGVEDPEVITFFDREDKASLPAIVKKLAAEMTGPGKSVMVHVEGTRSLECRTPVQKMSGAFLDMAVAIGAPVVPVRFVGALPASPLEARIEFPVGYGQQDIYLGEPLQPEVLAGLPYKERKERVIDAINATGPWSASEEPFPGDPAFAGRVWERIGRTGVDEPHAVLMELLAELADPTPATVALLVGDRTGTLTTTPDPLGQWVGELARRLYGPNGAKIR